MTSAMEARIGANTLRDGDMVGCSPKYGGRRGARPQRPLVGADTTYQRSSQSSPRKVTEAIPAESGIVKIQAHTIRLAKPQRMPRILVVDPTPMMAPVMVWVVDTGMWSEV